jgi:catechol 2,3-dioxygenase-like lactoylglutathione lyase family enzyme
MIGYTMLGTNDYERALAFYDDLLGVVGSRRAMDFGNAVAYGFAKGPMFAVTKPYNGQPATAGNGTMIALNAGSQENVQKMHARAIALGGVCDGPVGPRGDGGFYAGYFRDLDGNKICAFTMG